MCLALACSNSFASSGLSQAPLSSSSKFILARPDAAASSATEGSANEGLTLAAKTLFYELGQQPAIYPNSASCKGIRVYSVLTYLLLATSVTFSGRHEGLALYFSRLVRPIWKSKITTGYVVIKHVVSQILSSRLSPVNNQSPSISATILSIVQRDLQSLKSFLDRYSNKG